MSEEQPTRSAEHSARPSQTSSSQSRPSQGRPSQGRPSQSGGRPPRQGGSGGGRPPRRNQGRRGYGSQSYGRRRKVCAFCLEKTKTIDYKDRATMRRFLTDLGKIKSRRKTGTCAKHQRRLAIAVKRARHLALLPFTAEHIRRY